LLLKRGEDKTVLTEPPNFFKKNIKNIAVQNSRLCGLPLSPLSTVNGGGSTAYGQTSIVNGQ
jgi:hypothetical protein